MQTLINEYMQELPSVIEESEYKVSARKAILLAKVYMIIMTGKCLVYQLYNSR